jgi:hypothetical protein
MPMPLDHVTVIQQINFAEWAHHDLQVHPEMTMLKARVIDDRNRAESRQRTNSTDTTRRSGFRLYGENYHLSDLLTGRTVDLKA